jgi:CheY-like chemotaxis protein
MISGARILLVEDDPDVCDLVAEALAGLGAIVCTASSGNTGLRAFLVESPDAVVSDLRMPNGSGYDLIERIRALPHDEGGLTPAIAISAAEHGDAALEAGFHAFSPKPVDPDQIASSIAEFVGADDKGQRAAPWTLSSTVPGVVTIALEGHLRSGDMLGMMKALCRHLDDGPCHVVADARLLTGFSPAVPSVGERAVWRSRRQVRSVFVVGATRVGRLVSATSCKILGIPCTFAESLEDVPLSSGARPTTR